MPEQASHILSSYDAALYGLRNYVLMMSSLADRILQTAFEAFLTSKLRSTKLMTDRRLPACTPELIRARPIASVQDLRGHTLLHSATTSSAWSEWLTLAGAPHLKPVQHMEFEHVHLQLEAALNGLGIALASLPLIQADLASGRLICPISKPEWSTQNYLLLSEHQEEDAAVRAFRSWIMDTARATVR